MQPITRFLFILMATILSTTACIAPVPLVEPIGTPVDRADNYDELTPEQQSILAELRNRGPVPELTNEVWINSEPLRLEDLRGQVVIVEFWTYG